MGLDPEQPSFLDYDTDIPTPSLWFMGEVQS